MQIFSELSAPFIQACAGLTKAKIRDFRAKQPIYLNRPEGKTFVVKRGYIRLMYVDSSGRLLTRMVIGKGAMFGDLPFRPHFFTSEERAISSGAASLIEIGREVIEKHTKVESQFQGIFLQTLAAQYSALDRRLQWQLITPIRSRVAAAVYDMVCFAGGRCGHGHLIDVRLTHEELSELIAAARPVVSEILLAFKALGFLDYTRGHICVLNMDELRAAIFDGFENRPSAE